MQINDSYTWLIGLEDGTIIKKFNPDGSVNRWEDLKFDKIVRFSFQPVLSSLSKHEVFIDIENGNEFVKYFSRSFLKQRDKFELKNCVWCLVTKQFRVYVNNKGECFLTPSNYEMRI